LRPYLAYILGVSLVFAALAYVVAYRMPAQYRATAKMLVRTRSDLDPTVRSFEVANLVTVLQSDSLLDAVRRELKLDEPPLSLSAAAFASSVTVRQMAGSNVVVVQVNLGKSDAAANTANAICRRGAEMSRHLNQQEALGTRDALTDQAEVALKRLQETEQALDSFRGANQLEVLQRDVDVTLDERAYLAQMQVDIAGKEARIAAAVTELSRHQKVDVLTRAIDSDKALTQAAQQAAPGKNVLGLVLRDEQVNPVYADLQQTIASTRTDLAELKRQERELVRSRKVTDSAFAKVAELHRREIQQARLDAEYGIAKKVYEDTKTRSQQASLDVASRSSTLQVFDPAAPPAGPIGPHPFRTAVLAFCASLVIASVAALAMHGLSPGHRVGDHV
jgi:uncharacterized protein involved in exopolysaccharide biosynthesis